MATYVEPSREVRRGPIKPPDLRVSAYDQVSSWLVALLMIVGFFVAVMFLIWLTYVIRFTADQSPVVLVENIAGRGDHAAGLARDAEAPGMEELEEVMEPQVEQMLEAVTTVVSTQAASLDAVQTDSITSNVGKGLGDSRPPGPLGEGDNIIPRWERWQIQYNTTTVDAYARQLDGFGIELGAAGGGTAFVDYALGLAGNPKTRQGAGDAEKRLYMTWSAGTLRLYDQQLLNKAGIRTRGRVMMQFYPPEIENNLAVMELNYAKSNGHQSVKEIRRTVFGVRKKGTGFEYYVISQAYRSPTT